jgi:hypothetical protein
MDVRAEARTYPTAEFTRRLSKTLACQRYPHTVAENVACNPALDSDLSSSGAASGTAGLYLSQMTVVAGLAAVVNYRNWPN